MVVSGQVHRAAASFQEKAPTCPLKKKWVPEPVRRFGRREFYLSPAWNQTITP